MNTKQKIAALGKQFDLHIVKVGEQMQVCDGSGRDGFVLAYAPTLIEAVDSAYARYISLN